MGSVQTKTGSLSPTATIGSATPNGCLIVSVRRISSTGTFLLPVRVRNWSPMSHGSPVLMVRSTWAPSWTCSIARSWAIPWAAGIPRQLHSTQFLSLHVPTTYKAPLYIVIGGLPIVRKHIKHCCETMASSRAIREQAIAGTMRSWSVSLDIWNVNLALSLVAKGNRGSSKFHKRFMNI